MFGVIFVPEDVKKREVRETNMGAPCQHTTALSVAVHKVLIMKKCFYYFPPGFSNPNNTIQSLLRSNAVHPETLCSIQKCHFRLFGVDPQERGLWDFGSSRMIVFLFLRL